MRLLCDRLTKCEREQVDAAREVLGHDDFEVAQGGKHKKLSWLHRGVRHTVIIVSSPGNNRFVLNLKTNIRQHVMRSGAR